MASGSYIQVKLLNDHVIVRDTYIDYKGRARSAKRNLFGGPEKGEINTLLMQEIEEKQSEFRSRYLIEDVFVPDENYGDFELQQDNSKVIVGATQSSEHKRTKPYARQTSMPDFYNQRKTCNKGRIMNIVYSSDEVNDELLTPSSNLDKVVAIKKSTTTNVGTTVPANTKVPASCESSPSILLLQTPDREKEYANNTKRREQNTLHTTTD